MGEYMLKGWVLTDIPCKTPNCPVPLMRSPARQHPPVSFCVKCDGEPGLQPPARTSTSHSTASLVTTSSNPTTPTSSVPSIPESPTFLDPSIQEQNMRRRAQSDRASSEIGTRLLQGWAMLAEECPNESCYGVPLVRPPKTGGEDPTKVCLAQPLA
ncbi:hypothetical protein BOTBODRAFT_120035 [Botryobasidium botryosum FD-172 SS1]|uniref:Uncharacterized protein n=1 Tax=Botryobasidium botryosum (strain FD-172 SS1) TaxID=930990 RepID=A0A067M7C0_BOTB1|nr:hypothetical protein BOTBODRAFT_120035 [Botryobasidium botryosum FD-172 SS1]